MATATADPTIDETMEKTARTYLQDRVYGILLSYREPAKVRDIVSALGLKYATPRLVKDALGSSDRFDKTERRWVLALNYEDSQRPIQAVLEEIVESCGRPIAVDEAIPSLASIYGRPADCYREMVSRLLGNTGYFFPVGDDRYGRAEWLIVTTADNEADVLYDSFLDEADVAAFRAAADKTTWTPGDLLEGASDFLKKVKSPIPMKVLQFFAWRSDPSGFEAASFYSAVGQSEDFILLSGGQVADSAMLKAINAALTALADKLEAEPAEGEDEEAEGPVAVTEADADEIVKLILASDGPARAEKILDSVLEVAPGERAYQPALQSLIELLRNDSRVLWVGADRWRAPDSAPDYVNDIPAVLAIPSYSFVTPEGDVLDQELEDDGLDSGLRGNIMDPLVMDVGDEDPLDKKRVQPMGDRQRCVLRYQHKEAGTLPLCQISPEFFGVEPAIINVTLMDEGVRRELWLNNETRLMYDLKDWYGTEMPVSGAVFYIEKTQKPDEFRFVYTGETDDKLFVQPGRLLELIELKDRAESQDMPTTDIIVTIMERYKQGVEFAPLFTEVNLVRRCTRRLVASILSSYHAFYRKETVWRYDSEKWTKGFNKTKRKYIKKA